MHAAMHAGMDGVRQWSAGVHRGMECRGAAVHRGMERRDGVQRCSQAEEESSAAVQRAVKGQKSRRALLLSARKMEHTELQGCRSGEGQPGGRGIKHRRAKSCEGVGHRGDAAHPLDGAHINTGDGGMQRVRSQPAPAPYGCGGDATYDATRCNI